MRLRLALLLGCAVSPAAACSFGPEEDRVEITQIVHVADSYEALIVVRHERLRPATGINAFPDGGRAMILERRARLYLTDATRRSVTLLVDQVPPDSLWESYRVSIRGLEGDSVAYVASTGCPRGGECYPELRNTMNLRVSLEGQARIVPGVPSGAALPGVMLGRRPGEEHYVRFSSDEGLVTARFEEDAPFQPLFEARWDGSLTPIGG